MFLLWDILFVENIKSIWEKMYCPRHKGMLDYEKSIEWGAINYCKKKKKNVLFIQTSSLIIFVSTSITHPTSPRIQLL